MGGFPKRLSVEDVTARLEKWLVAHGNKRFKLGAVEERGEFAVGAEVTTTDDNLVAGS